MRATKYNMPKDAPDTLDIPLESAAIQPRLQERGVIRLVVHRELFIVQLREAELSSCSAQARRLNMYKIQ